jgi:membrane protein insertase Oxa1/YidC/SpoIIIJ
MLRNSSRVPVSLLRSLAHKPQHLKSYVVTPILSSQIRSFSITTSQLNNAPASTTATPITPTPPITVPDPVTITTPTNIQVNVDNFDSLKADSITAAASWFDNLWDKLSPVNWAQELLEWTHATTGLPWWATIAVIGLGMRLLSSPFNIIASKNSAVLANHSEEYRILQSKMVCHKFKNNANDCSASLMI